MENHLYKTKYGGWGGNPEGHKPDFARCCEEVGRNIGRWTSFGQCTRKRGYGPDKAYCKQHDPEAVRARRKALDAKYNEQHNKDRYRRYGPTFYNALKKIADGHNDARGLAKETLDEFHRGERK